MNKRFYKTALAGLFALTGIFGCTKLDTTVLGSDIIPEIDNINTFADTMEIVSTQHIFADTVRLSKTENHVLGKITNDPLFGQTDASVYVQFKPTFFPFFLGISQDTLIGIDSMVLTLAYKGLYGDSSVDQRLEVREIDPATGGLWDSVYKDRPLSFAPSLLGVVGSKTIDIRNLDNKVIFANRRDSSTNQIRIKLEQSYVDQFIAQDSTATGPDNGFFSDSLFSRKFKGLGITSVNGGNALMYISLTDPLSRLEIHFRKRRNNVTDTVYSSLRLSVSGLGTITPSATANHIVRNRPAFTPPEIYLQTTPGTYALLNVPRLNSFKDTNRIIHRAEIFMQQIPGDFVSDSLFPAPNFLYMDLKDTSVTERYKAIYLDLNPGAGYDPDVSNAYFPGQIDFGYFGGYQRRRVDAGRSVAYYNFNITRYVQRMLLKNAPNYTFRLFSPFSINYPQYSSTTIPFNNSLAYGRVRVGGGDHPVHPMKMVVIWSKIK